MGRPRKTEEPMISTINRDFHGKKVTCKDCEITYVATPDNDYYAATNPANGICLECLAKTEKKLQHT